MKSRSKPRSTERRDFLKGVAIASGATAIAAVSAAPLLDDATPDSQSVSENTPDRTYHLTEHIRDYYRSLR